MLNELPAESAYLSVLNSEQTSFYHKCMQELGFRYTPFEIDIRSSVADLLKLRKGATQKFISLTTENILSDKILPLNQKGKVLIRLVGEIPLGPYTKESIHKFHHAIGYTLFIQISAAAIKDQTAQNTYLESAQHYLQNFLQLVFENNFDQIQQSSTEAIQETNFCSSTRLAGQPLPS